jgi:coproporphyrinogen III oxidase
MAAFQREVEAHFRSLRDRIVAGLAALDGGQFERKAWERPGGGGGEMSQLRGALFEKAGCNFSSVSGERYPSVPAGTPQGEGRTGAPAEGRAGAPSEVRPGSEQPGRADGDDDAALGIRPPRPEELAGKPFFATGVSLVVHPRSPWVPVVHLNVRYLEVGEAAWFGGGADLTPCRPFPEDTAHFHGVLQQCCNKHDARYYPRFSRWARDYFFLPHRGSERGVGGIFFDYLRDDAARFWPLVRGVGDAFLEAYAPIVERRRDQPFTEAEREEQLRWRGRYVEFNLLYDRGTIFGLRTGGNLEAIFMSLPPLVAW